MPEYTATFFFADGGTEKLVLFALDEQEAVRRSRANATQATSIEIRSGSKLVAIVENPADAEADTAGAAQRGRALPEPAADEFHRAAETGLRPEDGLNAFVGRREGGNRRTLAILLGAFLCATAFALLGWVFQPEDKGSVLSGMATVVNGGTLILDGQPIWLSGIDAPKLSTEAGKEAYRLMIDLTEGQDVVCIEKERDQDERLFADCSANGRDLAEALVDAGAVRRIE